MKSKKSNKSNKLSKLNKSNTDVINNVIKLLNVIHSNPKLTDAETYEENWHIIAEKILNKIDKQSFNYFSSFDLNAMHTAFDRVNKILNK